MKPIDDLDEQQKNEESTKLKYITPAIQKKWNADGDRIVFLFKNNLPLALVEAKGYDHDVNDGVGLNCLLTQIPSHVRKYVIVHELAHRKEMNHSDRFWKIVAKEMPDYQWSVRWPKEYGDNVIERL